jgi:hypothetical protein
MSELSPPLSSQDRAPRRLEAIERTSAQIARLQSDLRLELVALALQDTPFGLRTYLCDELALALAESPGTADRMLLQAHRYSEYPQVIARVGLPLADGGWSVRHADALLDAIAGLGLGLEPAVQEQILDLVAAHPDARTPHQIRRAAQAAALVMDPEAAERRLAKAKDRRHVGADASSDGSGMFWAKGTAGQIAMVMASVDALAGPKQPGDPRTLDQRRFDALMDLICGRALPGQWQALVVVTLATLDGSSQEPAEIPGFGLISAGEARELAAHAELRRAVVDDRGELVSIDSHPHRPDLPSVVELDAPDRLLSLDTEPEPVDTTPEQQPDHADLTWLHQQSLDEVADVVAMLTSNFEEQLRSLLTDRALFGLVDQLTPTRVIEIDGPGWRGLHDEPPGPPSPPASGPPPEPPDREPEPAPPSFDDLDWHERTQDRAAQDALEPPPTYEREPRTGPTLPPLSTAWTREALHAAHTRLRGAPVDPRPMSSAAYALPPRLARFIKHRDITCSFPGCLRLARDSQNDHLIPWPKGRSEAANMDCKCTHHHQAKTHGGYQTERLPNGAIRWTTPLGRTRDRHPRPLLRGF